MPTTSSLTERQDTTHPATPDSTTVEDTPASSPTPRQHIDVAPGRPAKAAARFGVGLAIAATVAVGALVVAVVNGPADTAVDPSTHDRVELNRAATLRDLVASPTDSYDRVELNRAATWRDLRVEPTDSYGRVELNRVATLRDLGSTSP